MLLYIVTWLLWDSNSTSQRCPTRDCSPRRPRKHHLAFKTPSWLQHGWLLLCLTFTLLSPSSINILTLVGQIYKLNSINHCEKVHSYKSTYLKQQMRAQKNYVKCLFQFQSYGYYRWTDKRKINFSNWYYGEPSQKTACVYLELRGTWKTAPCDEKHFPVCKKSEGKEWWWLSDLWQKPCWICLVWNRNV